MGALHMIAPRPFDALIPERLPGRARTWTYLSGVAELGCAAAVAYPRTRKAGALATAALMAAVFPANVKMARDWRRRPAAAGDRLRSPAVAGADDRLRPSRRPYRRLNAPSGPRRGGPDGAGA